MAKKPSTEEHIRFNKWMGHRFAQIRMSAGFSTKRLAVMMNISYLTIENIEDGTQTINSRDLYNASIVLSIHVSEFFPPIEFTETFDFTKIDDVIKELPIIKRRALRVKPKE